MMMAQFQEDLLQTSNCDPRQDIFVQKNNYGWYFLHVSLCITLYIKSSIVNKVVAKESVSNNSENSSTHKRYAFPMHYSLSYHTVMWSSVFCLHVLVRLFYVRVYSIIFLKICFVCFCIRYSECIFLLMKTTWHVSSSEKSPCTWVDRMIGR